MASYDCYQVAHERFNDSASFLKLCNRLLMMGHMDELQGMLNGSGPPIPTMLRPSSVITEQIQVLLVVLYVATALFSILGNTLSLVVLIYGKRSRSQLRMYLINLAAADMAMAIFSIPFTFTEVMLDRWIFPPALCPIVRSVQLLSLHASVATLTSIGIDR